MQKVEELRIGIFAVDDRLATSREVKGSGEVCAELIKGCILSKVIAPELSDGIGIGVNVITIALIPVVVSRNDQKVGATAE